MNSIEEILQNINLKILKWKSW